MTLVGLSQQLHQPSQVLSRKYSSSHYSRVSKILEQFLARQASIASYTPPSPPSDVVTSESKPYEGEIGLATPQKTPHPSNMPHGYITPPITPENEAFANGNNAGYVKTVQMPNACSPSPTPSPSVQYMAPNPYQQEATYQQQYLQPQMSFTTGY
jgi:hypothetical protein